MAIVEISITPLGTGTTSMSDYVVDCHKVLKDSKVSKYQLTPMGTIIEGDLDLIFGLIRKMHEVPFDQGAMRVATTIKIDDRRDKKATMEQKLNSVQIKLQK